ncbi:putative membrane protein [Asticcacaulis biprosthecium C19]|uniref:Putative membrane protein n=1 Tax=Asticcacaulis biprosthecium C19 TaxID=715226 RepID=F4QQ38_9CAUL|nr:putative membrane protein [Asticcacaulis biprosthecium C19]
MTKALSAAIAGLPAVWGGAGLALLLLWATAVGGPLLVLQHPSAWLCLALVALVAIFKVISLGALYRTALFGKEARKEGLGPLGLQFGLPEVRLIVASLLVLLFVAFIAAAIAIVLMVGFRMNDVDPLHAGPWGLAGAAIAQLLLLFVLVKFSLLHAANIAQRKLVTLNALGLTSGQAGKLFFGIVVLSLPFALLCAGVVHQFAPEIRLAQALPYPWLNQRMSLVLYGGLLLLQVGVLLPLLTGFFASAYRQIERLRAE